ncbi:MAG: PIN domain-containing protein [Panacagrimonas sp.]
MKVFLDTNVWVSASVARGICADLVRLLLDRMEFGEARILISTAMREEYVRTMTSKLRADDQQINGDAGSA